MGGDQDHRQLTPVEESIRLRRDAVVLREAGRHAEAEAALRRAVALTPQDAEALADLAAALTLMGRPADAEPWYRRALELDPGDVFTLSNLAGALQKLGRPKEAEPLYAEALRRRPDHLPALRNLSVLMKDSSRLLEAKALALRASKLDAGLEPAIQAHLAITPIIRSAGAIDVERQAYAQGLADLAADSRTFAYGGEKANLPWYYLAYHNRDDRALLERTAEVLRRKIRDLDYVAPHLAHWRAPRAQDRRIRVAFCSEFLGAHTIGRLYRGLIGGLDRKRFEVILLHGRHGPRDRFRDELDALADGAAVLPSGMAAEREMVAAMAPDILFFPDIGMSADTYFLAHSRLAPVQATSWGHPNTSGLPTLDYFVSCDAIEPEGAESRYTERLVRLSRLPCSYPAPPPPPAAPREALRLPAGRLLYGCPQSLFKFHPGFDAILAEILEQVPESRLVLLGAHNPLWTETLKERWAAAFPTLLERTLFLPRLSHDGFMALMPHIDVLLDPVHFGSGNTLYEGISTGTPIVTWPGGFARGRIVAAAYAQMKVADAPVAESLEQYASLAVALGRDPARRARLRAELIAKAPTNLYDDHAAVRELEAFLEHAVEAAGRGARLPAGWRPQEMP